MNNFLTLLLTTGGGAFIAALIAGIKNLSTVKLESEAALIKRLNDDAATSRLEAERQSARAERAEKYVEDLRIKVDDALDLASQYRRLLIENGITLDNSKKEIP